MRFFSKKTKKTAFSKVLMPIIFLSASSSIYGQAPALSWRKALGGSGNDMGLSVQKTSDNGFVIAGSTLSSNGDVTGAKGGLDVWVVKMTSSGEIEWKAVLGGSQDDEANSIQQTLDGGYILAGYTKSNDGDVSGNHATDGSSDFWVVKLTPQGAITWQKCLGGNKDDNAKSVRQNADGTYIVVGNTFSNNGNVSGNHSTNGFSCDYWVVKLNSAGTIIFQKTFGGSLDETANSVMPTTDGGYIVAGNAESTNGDVTGNHGGYDAWILKLSAAGIIEWKKTFGGSGEEHANAVRQLVDGGYVIAGVGESTDGDLAGAGYTGTGGDCWVLKLNASGDITMNKLYGGGAADIAYDIEQTTKGFVVAAYTNSKNGNVTGAHEGGEMWVFKLLANGTLEWQKALGGNSQEQGYSVKQVSDGGYIIVGETNSLNTGDVTGHHGAKDVWVVKLASDGDLPVLPLNLISFKALKQNNSVQLNWVTSSEQNTSHFDVERSSDGLNFAKIKQLSALGSSTSDNSYTIIDESPLSGKNFYRLKSIDKDERFTWSNIVEVVFSADALVTIHPNPVSSSLKILIQNSLEKNATVQVTDMQGKILINKTFSLISGQNSVVLPVQALPVGSYMARIVKGNEVNVLKFIKQ
jgi:hypothetical protein